MEASRDDVTVFESVSLYTLLSTFFKDLVSLSLFTLEKLWTSLASHYFVCGKLALQ
jgi:hypothetical protein